ncbi:hypothetical protein KU15F69_18740 [Escherichia coli]|uniref:hypothetical protein n=1 Tax=Escherichia coli TaxID=562 RepID=UPI00254C67B8|nr:hypothetical protein [Escherichia coli]
MVRSGSNCHRQSYTHCLVLPYHGPNVIGLWWPVLNSGLTAIGVDGTPRFIAAGVRTDYSTSFRTCSAMGDTFTRPEQLSLA